MDDNLKGRYVTASCTCINCMNCANKNTSKKKLQLPPAEGDPDTSPKPHGQLSFPTTPDMSFVTAGVGIFCFFFASINRDRTCTSLEWIHRNRNSFPQVIFLSVNWRHLLPIQSNCDRTHRKFLTCLAMASFFCKYSICSSTARIFRRASSSAIFLLSFFSLSSNSFTLCLSSSS